MECNEWGVPAYAIDLSRTSLGFRLVLIAITLAACVGFFVCGDSSGGEAPAPTAKPTIVMLPTT
jgi:hypothetical protein